MRYQMFFVAVSLFVPTLTAAGDMQQLCTAGGYFSGAQDRFMSSLVADILSKRKELGGKECSALWERSFPVGERFSKSGTVAPADAAVADDAAAVSSRVYGAIAKGAGY